MVWKLECHLLYFLVHTICSFILLKIILISHVRMMYLHFFLVIIKDWFYIDSLNAIECIQKAYYSWFQKLDLPFLNWTSTLLMFNDISWIFITRISRRMVWKGLYLNCLLIFPNMYTILLTRVYSMFAEWKLN